MEKQAKICETYQLKWTSFPSYIHSCISTSLHQTDSFADVALVTTDGHQIMAHRYVLAYSSLFLGQILKMQKKVTTALPLMIVLPPEIDHKCLKVLVRYMYSGEAKVSKEILQNVLKGGDILQIKGLYREAEDTDKHAKLTKPPERSAPVASSEPTKPPPLAISTSSASSTVTKPTTQHKKQQPLSTVVTTKSHDKNKPKVIYVQKPNKSTYPSNQIQKVLNFTIMQNFDKKDETTDRVTILNKSLLDQSKNDGNEKGVDQTMTVKSEPKETNNLQCLMIKEEPIDWNDAEMEIMDTKEEFDHMNVKSEEEEEEEEEEEDNNTETNGSESNEEVLFSPLTCELCTETFNIPGDWVRHVQTHTDMLPAKRRRRDSTGDSYENDTFPELMCDLCQKSFPTPAEWVRHVHTHTEFELHLSNRKHAGKSTTVSETAKAAAAAASSSAATAKTVTSTGISSKVITSGLGENNICTDCDKTFPSNASMMVHKRKHTGEKPFACQFCPKNFNVKSNLMRHLRTIHNTIPHHKQLNGSR